MAIKQSKC